MAGGLGSTMKRTKSSAGRGGRPRIGIDLHTLEGLHQGSRTHCLELFSRIAKRLPEMDFFFFVDTGRWDAGDAALFCGPNAQVVSMPHRNSVFRLLFQLPSLVKEHGIDLLHTQYICPLRLSASTAVTIHDLLPEDFPQYFGRIFRWRSKVLFPWSARKSAMVFTVSDYSKSRLTSIYKLEDKKLFVLLNGVDRSRFYPGNEGAEALRDLGLVPGQYLLMVGRLEPRKNHQGLLRAYAALAAPRPRLVIVGQRDFGYQAIFKLCGELGLENEVMFLEGVENELLASLHRHARLFVYPAFAEGFGMPVIEAMASGVPVVTSNTTAIREIGEGVALLVDPASFDSIGAGIARVLREEGLADKMVLLGPRHAEKFSWEESADVLAEAYRGHFSAAMGLVR